jgi:hypothetical protein
MIKVNIKMPSAESLMRAAMTQVEQDITQKARRAASLYGGVTVKFKRKPNGSLSAVNFQGSEAAVQAVQAALKD